MTTYIGLDLAWSAKNATGAAVLRGGPGGAALVGEPELLYGITTIIDYVLRQAGSGPAIVAVDAPLRVPNATGRRAAEAELNRAFRRYEAGAHPANRTLLARGEGGAIRGELLLAALAQHGFAPAALIDAGVAGRWVTEVYPHPAMIALFGLAKTLKYKARPGRSEAERYAAWRQYHAGLRRLAAADPPLHGELPLLDVHPASLRGSALKHYEDRVDALFCAYIALYAHRWGAARCRAFGTLEAGWILTPVPAGSA
jgi:predicted RNase H-like nuclease